MATVTRRDRLWDVGAFVLILAGTLGFLVAAARLREISAYTWAHPGPRSRPALQAADDARYLAYGGLAAIVAGVGVGVVAAARVARRRV